MLGHVLRMANQQLILRRIASHVIYAGAAFVMAGLIGVRAKHKTRDVFLRGRRLSDPTVM